MDKRSVVLLLSSGRHPVTGRTRAADCDARALRLGLKLQAQGWDLTAFHAGEADDAALGEYFGMGLSAITVLGPLAQTDDAMPVLLNAVSTLQPTLILCGQAAENGEGSGMTPYLLAAALDLPVVANVSDVTCAPSGLSIFRAEPAGRRRQYALAGSAVLAVGTFAAPPLPFAYGRMRRGVTAVETADALPDSERMEWELLPARSRPARLKAAKAGGEPSSRRALTGLAPDQAAAEILEFLKHINVLKCPSPAERQN